jgi:hypothetical protein
VDDASPLVSWEYQQAAGEQAVVVQIWASTEEAPAHFTVISPPPKRKRREPLRGAPDAPGALARARREEHAPRINIHSSAYYPPRTMLPNAAQQAEETFAPAQEESAAVQAVRLAIEAGLPVRFVHKDKP